MTWSTGPPPPPPKVPGTPRSGNHGFSSPAFWSGTFPHEKTWPSHPPRWCKPLKRRRPWSYWTWHLGKVDIMNVATNHQSFFFKWDVVGLVCRSVRYSYIYIYMLYTIYRCVCMHFCDKFELNVQGDAFSIRYSWYQIRTLKSALKNGASTG